ncbi:type VI secretion system protein TssA [Vibrio algivorus]|uniref:Type VI secretion system protein TssA n=1 Tax=Vibrio algivorus TaxID=1667024 RepID=A0A557P5G4_9VIBR|nr:type VI secretion system protein TssA [Vibrio algivorus]TVO35878.1 type VI secretion system protein TssA [Vibrio algivorus]
MNIQEYRQIIVSPISADSPVGERLYDDPLYDFIDEQMMKVGSLSHGSVQWSEVEQNILKLFKDKTKDIKLLIHLIQCLHHQATPERLTLSLLIFSDFMQAFWQTCYPSPGERGKLPRRKFFSLLLQRFDLLTDKFDFTLFDADGKASLLQALEGWHSVVDKNELDSESVDFFVQRIKNKLQDAQARAIVNSQATVTRDTNAGVGHVTNVNVQQGSPLSFDSSSSQLVKQTLLKVSDFLSEQEYGALLSIRVKRYAIWSGIESLPEHNNQNETLLRGMQTERLKEYTDAMTNPDIALWKKVENSLMLAPYWIDGQFLSAQIAQSLGLDDWGEVILDETKQFLFRLPQLTELKFKDGTPFVSSETRKWIDNSMTSQSAKSVGHWQETFEQIKQLSKDAGMNIAISSVNDGLKSAIEPRDKFYWRCLLAELLEENNLAAVAHEQYRSLYEEIMTVNLTEWEPSLIEKLKKINNIK